jgi:hypothetical protein
MGSWFRPWPWRSQVVGLSADSIDRLRLALQPIHIQRRRAAHFARYPAFRLNNKAAPVRRWSRSGAAGATRRRLATFDCPITSISPPMFNFEHRLIFVEQAS